MTQVGPAQFSIEGCHGATDCYEAARETCPYGFDVLDHGRTDSLFVQSYFGQTTATPVQRDEMIAQCREPVFCEAQPCAYGFTCTISRRYPGRRVCTM